MTVRSSSVYQLFRSKSPSGVRSIWLRHDLAAFKQRLVRLERKIADEGIIMTEAQVQALEKKRDDDIACGEIETAKYSLSYYRLNNRPRKRLEYKTPSQVFFKSGVALQT